MSTSFKNNFSLFTFFILLLVSDSALAQLAAHAGNDHILCPDTGALIGATPAATGGIPPYRYQWSPSAGLNNISLPNPTTTTSTDITYTLTVTDDAGAVSTDEINITINYIQYVNAGMDTSICEKSVALIGGLYNVSGAGVTYSWSADTTLDNTEAPRPIASPVATTTYTLTATVIGCPSKTDEVTVTVIPTPKIDAGADITINNGQTITLHANGAYFYSWSPLDALTYFYTEAPDAEPHVTTTYHVFGKDKTGECPAYDSVIITVLPSDTVIFYNTFTPNGHGNNDTWYISNVDKYPDNKLQIYNRNGREVFSITGYINNWDGKAFGEDLPAATYFYIMDLGDDRGKFHGTVTIIR